MLATNTSSSLEELTQKLGKTDDVFSAKRDSGLPVRWMRVGFALA